MLIGKIVENEPWTVVNTAWNGNVQELVVLVDTGFTGELKVSEQDALDLGLEITHTKTVELANDTTIVMHCALANVAMDGGQEIVDVLIGTGGPMIGVGLLKKFQCTMKMDFRFDRLEITRCAPTAVCP